MYYQITGELIHIEPNAAVLDAGGVGYYLFITANTHLKISPHKGERVRLYTYLAVREDALELYGFYDYDELSAFKMLISVSGVGAKSALSILGRVTPEKFAIAVASGDVKAIKAPGVGPKIAARIVLELKDKLAKEFAETDGDMTGGPAAKAVGGKLSDAQNTLMVLGYTRSEAIAVLRDIDPALELEDIIKAALKKLSS
ncbi:MAG: Holliday junction branch migration protein RuvA [Eubacteriales bacterium]